MVGCMVLRGIALRCIDTLILMLGWVKTNSLAFPAHFKIHNKWAKKNKNKERKKNLSGKKYCRREEKMKRRHPSKKREEAPMRRERLPYHCWWPTFREERGSPRGDSLLPTLTPSSRGDSPFGPMKSNNNDTESFHEELWSKRGQFQDNSGQKKIRDWQGL